MIGAVDVVVVGAGPAGTTTAAKLAAAGLDVVILDKIQFPRDKPCGGGLSPKAHRLLDVDVDDLVLARSRCVSLRAPGIPPVSLEARTGAIWMVQRHAFDRRLLDHAVELGARFEPTAVVHGVTIGGPSDLATIETSRGRYQARAIVGADGADSVVARAVGLRPRREERFVLAIEAEAPRPDYVPETDALIDFGVSRGYGWLFPKGRWCNVGVGTDDRREFRRLRRHLADFLDRNQIQFRDSLRVVGHKIPTWRGAEPLHRGNAVLVGDAAGVADPFFGEGIAYAIQTGRFAAAAVGRFCAGDWPDLSGYTLAVQNVLARDLRFWSLLGRVVYRAPGLAVRALAASRRAQALADGAITGRLSFSRSWQPG